MAKAAQPEQMGRMKQILLAFRVTAKRDKLFIPYVAGAVLLALGITALLLFWLAWWFAILFGIMLVLLAMLVVLNWRGNRTFLAEAEGQPGAAASIIENMRGDYRVTPAVQSTTQMDFVHLVICRGGVVLVGEVGKGEKSRVRNMIAQEKKRLSKVIGSADLRDIMIGRGEGEVPLNKLRMTFVRLPRTLSQKDVAALDQRIKALTARPQLPKGAIPKNMRPSKGAFRATRGGQR